MRRTTSVDSDAQETQCGLALICHKVSVSLIWSNQTVSQSSELCKEGDAHLDDKKSKCEQVACVILGQEECARRSRQVRIKFIVSTHCERSLGACMGTHRNDRIRLLLSRRTAGLD